MEIKETYALVMAEDGQILRVVYKDGMKVGNRIYILEEDILKKDSFKEENHASIIPFAERKKTGNQHKTFWKKMVAVAAACALFVTSFAVLSKPEKAYAMVSVDGEKAVEVVLNQKNRVKEADSKNDSLTGEEKKETEGEQASKFRERKEYKPRREGEFKPRRESEFRPRREGDSRPRREGEYKPRREEGEFKREGNRERKPQGEFRSRRDPKAPREFKGNREPRIPKKEEE